MALNARTLSWNSGCLYREPQKRHKPGANSPREGGRRTLLDRAEQPVRDMLLGRSFSRRSGLLMPVSRWISISDRANMMAPLFTLAWQAATYQAGIPTQSWGQETGGRRLCVAVEGLTHPAQDWGAGGGGGGAHTHLQPDHNSWPVPLCQGMPCLQASSSNSCLQVTKHSKFKNHYYTRV